MAEQVRLVEMKRVDDIRIAEHGIERLETRDHAAAGARRNQSEPRRCATRRAQKLGLNHGPAGRCTTLRRLVERLEGDAGGIELR